MIPLVFVHGLMGGGQQWPLQAGAFPGQTLITLDLPGYGENADADAFDTIAGFANWALDELTARGVDRFHLLGHSMGGMIVQEMIAIAPERVERLVLYGTGAAGVLPGRFETIATSKDRARADGPHATAQRIAATWFLQREEAAQYPECAAIAARSSLQAILAGLDAMNGWSGAETLAQIAAKTLIIWGDHDRTYPWSQTQELWQTIPGASLAVIPNCAHAPHLEQPAVFNAVLNTFLEA